MLIIQWGRNPIMVTNKSFIPNHYKQKDKKKYKAKNKPSLCSGSCDDFNANKQL